MLSTLLILPTLAMAQWIGALLIVGFLFVCVLLILIILIQKPQGGGLSGAFGAGAASGSGQTVFGARTGDALTVGTISVFVLYLLVAIGLNYAIRPVAPKSAIPVAAEQQTAPTADDQVAPDTTTTNPPPQNSPVTSPPGPESPEPEPQP